MKWIIWVKISCFNPANFRWAMSCRRIGELSQKRITNYFYLHYYFLRNKKINWHSIIHSDRIVVLSHHRLFYSKMDFYCFEFYVMSTLPNTATFDPPSVGIHFSNFFTLSIARKCLKTVIGVTSNSASNLAFNLSLINMDFSSAHFQNKLIFRSFLKKQINKKEFINTM